MVADVMRSHEGRDTRVPAYLAQFLDLPCGGDEIEAFIDPEIDGLVGEALAGDQGGDEDARIQNRLHLAADLFVAVFPDGVLDAGLGFVHIDSGVMLVCFAEHMPE